MLVKDLIEKLSAFDPNLEVKIDTPAGGKYAVELRELVRAHCDKIEHTQQAVCIFGDNGGGFGYSPLDYGDRWQILRDFASGKNFTSIHGDCRMYRRLGGGNDTCYGQAYDPRLFLKLAEEGYLLRHSDFNGVVYAITEKGRDALAQHDPAKEIE